MCDSRFKLVAAYLAEFVSDDPPPEIDEVRLGQACEAVLVVRAASSVSDRHVVDLVLAEELARVVAEVLDIETEEHHFAAVCLC